jgi:small subunit ribosomal protein S20
MPHTKSAKKNLRKSEKRRLHNRAVKRNIKTQMKSFLAAVDGPIDQLQKEYNLAAKQLDKAAAKRVIHPNLADRGRGEQTRVKFTFRAKRKHALL